MRKGRFYTLEFIQFSAKLTAESKQSIAQTVRNLGVNINKIRRKELIKRGVGSELACTVAWSAKGPWKLSHSPGV